MTGRLSTLAHEVERDAKRARDLSAAIGWLESHGSADITDQVANVAVEMRIATRVEGCSSAEWLIVERIRAGWPHLVADALENARLELGQILDRYQPLLEGGPSSVQGSANDAPMVDPSR